jgi:ADP-ribosyl-[dinitrogen reductase] hydrolase
MALGRSSIDRDHARGALIGLAVGDALGATLEFSKPAATRFPATLDGPHREITGGGPF